MEKKREKEILLFRSGGRVRSYYYYFELGSLVISRLTSPVPRYDLRVHGLLLTRTRIMIVSLAWFHYAFARAFGVVLSIFSLAFTWTGPISLFLYTAVLHAPFAIKH